MYQSFTYDLSIHLHAYFSIAYTQMPLINVNAHVLKFYLLSEYSASCILYYRICANAPYKRRIKSYTNDLRIHLHAYLSIAYAQMPFINVNAYVV